MINFCRYSGRGLFLNAPYIGLKKGTWKITSAQHTAKSWTSIEEVLDISRQDSNEAQSYEQEIEAYIDRYNPNPVYHLHTKTENLSL